MKHAHKLILLGATAALGLAASAAQAGVLSIGDYSPAETITLQVAQPSNSTTLPTPAPGTGDFIDLSKSSDPAHGLSDIKYNQAHETLSFTFANQIPWNQDVYYYQYYTEPGSSQLSDLFVIQGYGPRNPNAIYGGPKGDQLGAPDYITFISDPGPLTGNVLNDVPLLAGSTATAINLGTIEEKPGWQLAFDTGVDQYYFSSVPGPVPGAGLAGLATLALAGLYARTRRA